MESKNKPHAVCIPLPAQGHINPMLKLAKLLHSRGFHVTFVHTQFNHNRLLNSTGPHSLSGLPDFRFETVSDGLPETNQRGILDLPVLCESMPVHCLESFRDLMVRLRDLKDVPPVSCVVSDGVMSFTMEVAEEFGLPELLFFTPSGCGMLGYLHFEELIQRGYFPLKDESCLTNGYLDTVIDWIPGMKGIRLKDLPTFIRTTNPQDTMFNYNLQSMTNALKSKSMILNTFDDLEHQFLDIIKTKFNNLYTIGPLSLLHRQLCNSEPLNSIQSNLWKEETECLDWLDRKEPSSVVYVNYGSLIIMTKEQLSEFAWGLANSKYSFLVHEGVFLNLMKHFSKSSLHERVLEMFNAIQTIVRQKPSLKAISTCLNLLIESNQVDLARTFLVNSKKNLNLEPNTCIFNILVKHHCKNGDLESAFQVVEEMKMSKISYPNLITYSTMMDGLCASGKLEEAVDLFEEMVSKDQILPDALTYNVLINGFSCRGKVDRAKKIIEFMNKNGCNPNVFNYSALMNGFCKEGRLQEANEAFNEMKRIGLKPDTVGYTTLIDSFCKAGKMDEAMELLEEMKEKECRADTVTFNVVIGGLCRQGRFEEALRMLYKLPNEGVYLNKASYRIVLNFLCKEGELGKAVELLCLMLSRGFVPHFATSNELLVRLCEAGKVADAAMVLFGLVEMGFKPEPDSWSLLVDLICRERKLLPAFELLDELVLVEQ